MLDVRQAVKMAHGYLIDLYPDQEVRNATLEEVELSEDDAFWFVTLSFRLGGADDLPFFPVQDKAKSYKIFKMQADDGRLVSMTMRDA